MSKAFDISKYAASITPPANGAERTLEVITREIQDAQRAGGEALLTIGRGLAEVKGRLEHGDWADWLSENFGYSVRTAQRLMKLSREWTNTTALSHLGAAKAFTLLALPPEERDSFMAENHIVDGEEKSVIDMTSRELDKAIRERNEALQAAEAARAEARTADESMAKMAQDMAALKEMHQSALAEAERASADLIAAQEELHALQDRPVDVAVQTVVDEEAVAAARREAVAQMQAKVDELTAAKAKADADLKRAGKELETARKQAAAHAEAVARAEKAEAELEEVRRQMTSVIEAQKQAKVPMGDEDVAMFKVLFDQVQQEVNKMHGLLMKVHGRDQASGEKLKKAVLALSDMVRRCAE